MTIKYLITSKDLLIKKHKRLFREGELFPCYYKSKFPLRVKAYNLLIKELKAYNRLIIIKVKHNKKVS